MEFKNKSLQEVFLGSSGSRACHLPIERLVFGSPAPLFCMSWSRYWTLNYSQCACLIRYLCVSNFFCQSHFVFSSTSLSHPLWLVSAIITPDTRYLVFMYSLNHTFPLLCPSSWLCDMVSGFQFVLLLFCSVYVWFVSCDFPGIQLSFKLIPCLRGPAYGSKFACSAAISWLNASTGVCVFVYLCVNVR